MLIPLIFASFAFALPEPNFRFAYVPNEGERVSCTHERIRDLPDWRVLCGGKEFVAHVILRETHREKTSSLEILYWVTARDSNPRIPPKFHSTTARLHFKQRAEPFVISLDQGVENDAASLQLEWRAGDF